MALYTEQEVRQMMDEGFKNGLKPLIDKMTTLLGDAYENGFQVGMEIGKRLNN